MAIYRGRRRRRRSWISGLRRFLINHRYSVAQGLLGALALVAGLWLLSPFTQVPPVDHRGQWQDSLKSDVSGPLTDEPVITVAEASIAVSAKGGQSGWSVQGRSLAQKAREPRVATVEPSLNAPNRIVGPVPSGFESAAVAVDGAIGVTQRGAIDAAVYRPSGMPTWMRNAVAAPPFDGRPAVAVMFDDMGWSWRTTAEVISLPAPLSLAFLPYGEDLERQTRAARARGHELLLHAPMQPVGRESAGPTALLTSLSPSEVRSRLRSHLLKVRGIVGVNNHMGSAFSADHPGMAIVMDELRQRGLLFVDSRTSPRTVGPAEARRFNVPYAERDIFLDNERDVEYVLGQLRQLERVARRKGMAIAIGHPHQVTIEAVRKWLPTLEQRGFVLVPVSAIVARQNCVTGFTAVSTTCRPHVLADAGADHPEAALIEQ